MQQWKHLTGVKRHKERNNICRNWCQGETMKGLKKSNNVWSFVL